MRRISDTLTEHDIAPIMESMHTVMAHAKNNTTNVLSLSLTATVVLNWMLPEHMEDAVVHSSTYSSADTTTTATSERLGPHCDPTSCFLHRGQTETDT